MKGPQRPSRRRVVASAAEHTEYIASLIQIVDHGSLSAAARAMRMPKSTLSRHLTQLEDALRAPVVVRGQGELVLTELGAKLVADARGPLSALSVTDPPERCPRGPPL